MTREEFELSLKNYQQAVARLKEIPDQKIDPILLRDAGIQRFEFTYELCWKTLKIYLNEKGILCSTPRECYQKALQQDLIKADDEALFLNMLKDRNLTSHVYREQTANQVYERICKDYIHLFDSLLLRLQSGGR